MGKIGRNESCPCGSGKKYKKCCENAAKPPRAQASTGPRLDIHESMQSFFSRTDLVPGCYDDPEFMRIERTNAKVVEEYAKYVLSRKQSEAETERVRAAVEAVASAIHRQAPASELQRSCNVVTNIMIRLLEGLGVWCFGVRGSAEFKLDTPHGPVIQSLDINDPPDFPGAFTGHAWLVAPPYVLVDCTVKYQGWSPDVARRLPDFIASENAKRVLTSTEKTCQRSPALKGRVPMQLLNLWQWLPARLVEEAGMQIRYESMGVQLPAESIDRLPLLGGKPITELLEKDIHPMLSVG